MHGLKQLLRNPFIKNWWADHPTPPFSNTPFLYRSVSLKSLGVCDKKFSHIFILWILLILSFPSITCQQWTLVVLGSLLSAYFLVRFNLCHHGSIAVTAPLTSPLRLPHCNLHTTTATVAAIPDSAANLSPPPEARRLNIAPYNFWWK